MLALDRGPDIPFEGDYSARPEQKQSRLETEGKQESSRQKALRRELEWIRQNPKGRQTKSKARINAYEKMLSEDFQKRREEMEIFIPAGPRLGNNVISAKNEIGRAHV